MIEKDLRAAFARHEAQTPAAGPLHASINAQVVRRKRRRLATRAAGVAAIALLGSATAPLAFGRQAATPVVDLFAAVAPAPAGPRNVLVVGVDGDAKRKERFADTVLIAHLPADRSGIVLVALPRDGRVEIPGRPEGRLSATYPMGGAELTRKAVTRATGVTFDATVTVELSAVRRLTDAVGGVPVCLPKPVTSRHTRAVYPAGCRSFTGAEATDLLRQRYGLKEGAYDRDRNGQRFLRGLVERLGANGALRDPARIVKLVTAAGPGLRVDAGDLGLTGLLGLIGATRTADVVSISDPQTAPILGKAGQYEGERLYPRVGAQLFTAVRDDRLADWTTANPSYVLR
jgi:LCP family protein required for cell wall assembly